MGQTSITIRTDETIKKQFDGLCNDFGMSVNTALNIFMRTVVRTKSIPFTIQSNLTTKEELLEKGQKVFELLRKESIENGLTALTLEDINKEISETRKSKR